MQQLIYFIQRYKYFLYFLLLQVIALALTINNHSFHRSKFVSSTNAVSGGLYDKSAELSGYLHLKTYNNELSEENKKLRNQLELLGVSLDSVFEKSIIDSLNFKQKYSYINGQIRKNEFHKADNFLLINRGKKDGVTKEMAVINGKGIIGITDNASNRYARVQSILNRNSRINARFKNNFYFGTLTWDGKNHNTVQLTDIPRQAVYQVGDTIITGGKSTIFPEGIPVGTVLNKPKNLTASNTINIKLFNDMSNLGYIYVVKSLDKQEIKELENKTNE